LQWHSKYCREYCLPKEYEFKLVDSYQLQQEVLEDLASVVATVTWQTESGQEILQTLPGIYHEYAYLFSREQMSKLPEHSKFDHTIELLSGKEAPFGPLYPFSEQELKPLKIWLDKKVEEGKIIKSKSSAGAPILLVRKSDGTYRLCMDYRALNKITIKNRYPLPLITELRQRLNKARIFTKFNLKNEYHLLRMAKKDEEKTAFRTRFGLYHWRVMPFGLCNTPATFQSMMDHILHDLLDEGVVVYLDNILVYTESVKEHERQVKEVLARLDKAGLGINLQKSTFHMDSVEFLGYGITPQGIRMTDQKIKEVKNWPVPRKVKDIQEFLEFANFYRRFIKGFSKVAYLLTELTHKNQTWNWSTRCQQAFDELKARFSTAPILSHFQSERETMLETDASDYAIKVVLSQGAEDGKVHPCAFLSRKFSPAEMNYNIHDKEMSAIIQAFKE